MRRNRYTELINLEPSKPPNPGETSNPAEMANPSNPSNPPNTSQTAKPSETTNTPNASEPSYPGNTSNPTETTYPGERTKPTKPPKTPYTSKAGNRAKRANPGEIAPTRDFTRVANSVLRDAVSGGVFTGKSKQLYDVLYARTRGAIVPRMSAQVPRETLMSAAHISSTITLKKNLMHLRESGLITWEERPGVRGGNEYTVYLPEEAERSKTSYPGNRGQKLEGLPGSETNQTNPGPGPIGSSVYGPPNTLFNTNKPIDDEGLETFLRFRARWAGLAGVDPLNGDWEDFFNSIDSECVGAISRAAVVSSLPAFLGEHLRRVLARRKAAPERSGAGKADMVQQVQSVEGMTMDEAVQMFKELLSGDSYTLEDIERQFRSGFTDEEWEKVLGFLRSS